MTDRRTTKLNKLYYYYYYY